MMFATTLTKIIVFHNLSGNGLNWTKVKDHSEFDLDSPTLYQKFFHLSRPEDSRKRPDYMKDAVTETEVFT